MMKWPTAQRWHSYMRLIRLDKPVGIWLLLWPSLWSLWIAAAGVPQTLTLTVFVLGVVLMRSAGCAINDYADRDIDRRVRRTRTRPLATGEVSPREALVLSVVLVLAAFGLVILLSWQVVLMSVPALGMAVTYPLMKRIHHLPQAYLGFAFSWGVLMAWVAETGAWPGAVAWTLFVACICWVIAYDTIYAIPDREYDKRAGVKSSPVLFGAYETVWIAVFQSATLALLVLVGIRVDLPPWFYAGLFVAAVLFAYQQWLIKGRDEYGCMRAFKNNAWVGFVIFIALVVSYR